MSQPTELQSTAAVERALNNLTVAALAAGATMKPIWDLNWAEPLGYCLVSGWFHSDDANALQTLEVWRPLLGTHGISSYAVVSPVPGRGMLRAVRVAAEVVGASVWLTAITPVEVRASVTATGIAVAA